uniref:TIL domain-containing protein n=1 Tax=Amblyomma maculatum TaxID=34609 RepID=G3MRI2_AMBMU
MSALQLLLLLGLSGVLATELWSQEYREHGRCLDRCQPNECPSGCSGNCSCYRRFDFPDHGYCLDPSKPIPDSFRTLGATNSA